MSGKPRKQPQPAAELQKERAQKGPSDKKRSDVVLIQGISDDGEALSVLRAREDRLEAGVVRSVKQGELGQRRQDEGEFVRLKPRPECPLVCDVEVDLPENALNAKGGSDQSSAHHGPAQVATPSYRANWDAIWKKPASSKKALPN